MDEQNQQRPQRAKMRFVRKRDDRVAPFDIEKIRLAIKAAAAETEEDVAVDIVANVVESRLIPRFDNGEVPHIEEIQDLVEEILMRSDYLRTSKAYILYRQKRAERRTQLQVRVESQQGGNSTDVALLVSPDTKAEYHPWDKMRIAEALQVESGLEEKEAFDVASAVERRIFKSGLKRISTALIREITDNELFERGHQAHLQKQISIGLPKHDIDQLIFHKSKENSNVAANNPEAIGHSISETIQKQYALQEIFAGDVADAHCQGLIHVHDLGYPCRLYCSSHSIEYLKKYGLRLDNLDSCSAPAKHARSLTTHLTTFLASMQAYYAGALGVAYVNIMYAPYLEGMSDKELKQEAQHLIFETSQSAFTRGGQVLFCDFNIHTGIPNYLKEVPAIGPGGEYTGKTYGEYDEIARRFTRAMLEVWQEGDGDGHGFVFPKLDIHINEDTLNEPDQMEVLEYACQIASENGAPYFIFDRDEVTLSACCRLRTTIEDDYMIKHPESMRFSFPGNEMVLVKYAGKVMSISFEKLYHLVDEDVVEEDGFEIKYVSNLEIWDQNGWTNVSRVLRHMKGDKDFCAIRTKGGKTIVTTEDHPIINQAIANKPEKCYHCDGNDYQEFGNTKYGKKLFRCKLCNRYFVSEQYVYDDNVLLNALDVCRDHALVDCLGMPDLKQFSDESQSVLSDGIAYVLGCYIGDGYYHKENNRFQISACARDKHYVLDKITRILSSNYICAKTYADRNNKRLVFQHDDLAKFARNHNVIGLSHEKQLPDCVFQLKPKYVWNIIAGLIDTDGTISGNNVCIGLNSKVALTQIQNWLEYHGYRSFLYTSKWGTKCSYIYNGEERPAWPFYKLEIPVTETVKVCLSESSKVCTMEPHEVDFFDDGDYRVKCNTKFDSPNDEYVYDITTDSSTFVSNGIVLHNCGFQNITVNLPQCAYRAGRGNYKAFLKELDNVIEICVKAHLQKKDFIHKLMAGPSMPLWQVGRIAPDGRPYVDLETCTYIIGILGLNECLQYLFHKELHESDEMLWKGLEIVSYMYLSAKELGQKHGIKFALEESPAESAARRLAKMDLRNYPQAMEFVRGSIDRDEPYYTNSIHIRPDADTDIITRIITQARFHEIIESGAIIHAFVGENLPSPEAIKHLVIKTFLDTNAAQLTISPEFTICENCRKISVGLKDECPHCQATNITEIKYVDPSDVVQENWKRPQK